MSKQKGIALVYTMAVLAISSAVVGLLSTSIGNFIKEDDLFDRQLRRNAIGRNITAALKNPAVILASLNSPLDTYNGNYMIKRCLGQNLSEASLQADGTVTGNNCNLESYDYDTGWEFLLASPSTYALGQSQASPPTNCPGGRAMSPNLQHMSCFIAGHRGPGYVTYNLRGDTSGPAPTDDFPFTAKVFFRPVCRASVPTQRSCQFAEQMQFRYEIEEHPNTRSAKRQLLGKYPTPHQWITLDTASIIGMTCNAGAVATGDDAIGSLACKCVSPYTPKLDASGQPVLNAKGAVCNTLERICPPGMNHMGDDVNGNPVCEILDQSTTSCLGDQYSSSEPYKKHSCGSGGYLTNIIRSCTSKFDFMYSECPEGCAVDWKYIALGGLIAVLFFAILVLMIVAGIMDAEIHTIAFLIGVGMTAMAGGAAGYVLGLNWDWVYLDQDRGDYPEISCITQLECSVPRGATCVPGINSSGVASLDGGTYSGSSGGGSGSSGGSSSSGGTSTSSPTPPTGLPRAVVVNGVTFTYQSGSTVQSAIPDYTTIDGVDYQNATVPNSTCTGATATNQTAASLPKQLDIGGNVYANPSGTTGALTPDTLNIGGFVYVLKSKCKAKP